jgi:acyl dehydratase
VTTVGDGRLCKFGVGFCQVWPGDTLDATATVEAIRKEGGKNYVDLAITTVNQSGVAVIQGSATALIDA